MTTIVKINGQDKQFEEGRGGEVTIDTLKTELTRLGIKFPEHLTKFTFFKLLRVTQMSEQHKKDYSKKAPTRGEIETAYGNIVNKKKEKVVVPDDEEEEDKKSDNKSKAAEEEPT